MDYQLKKFIEAHLWKMWLRLNLDKPSNWQEIVYFVIDDVQYSSDYLLNGDFHSGDIEIAFRRYIEVELLLNIEKAVQECDATEASY